MRRLLVLTLASLLACADKGAPAETSDAEPPSTTFACSGFEAALGGIPERDFGVWLSYPSASCEGGTWSFRAHVSSPDDVDEVRVMPWSAATGTFGAATMLSREDTYNFTGELSTSAAGFSCDGDLEEGFVFAPYLDGKLGSAKGSGGRGGASYGWAGRSDGDFVYEVYTTPGVVLALWAVACNPVTGVSWGPFPMSDRSGVDTGGGASEIWSVPIDLAGAGLGTADEVLLAATGIGESGTIVASHFGGG